MAKYTVQNAAGKKITFQWDDPNPPTDSDMEEIFAAAGQPSATAAPAAAPKVESPVFPTAANIGGKGLGPSLKRIGSGAMDMIDVPTRAAATLRGQSMADPDAYFFKPEVEAMKIPLAKIQPMRDEYRNRRQATMGSMGAAVPDLYGGVEPTATNAVIEAGGRIASDPTLGISKIAKTAGNVVKVGQRAVLGAIPRIKSYVSGLAQVKQPLLEKAATADGLAKIQAGAKMNPEDLGQQIAEDAGKVNKYREELKTGSEARQQEQILEENDRLALENQGINARLKTQAEQENARRALENQQVNAKLGEEAEARTRFQEDLAAESRRRQQQQTEAGILRARKLATGAEAGSLAEIKPGALGEDIKASVMGGKGEMQTAWLKGDQESVGPLRDKPAPVAMPATENLPELKVLTQKLTDVLEKYKAYDPGQGMRRISEGAKSILFDLSAHSQTSGHTVDDLLNIKAELRRARNLDKYKGMPFDLSVDDVAFGDADREISAVIDEALKRAAPKEAGAITEMMKAKDRQYAITKDLLGDQARTLGATQNSAGIIAKVKAMGPEKARELIAGAESNPALQGLVPKLRQAFVDDLILGAMKNGEFSADAMAKQWSAPGMQEMKAAWLSPDDLKRIDGALALGTAEMGRPAAMKPQRVPMPPPVEAKSVPMPPRIGSPADRSDGFLSRLAREKVEAPPKVGRSFSFDGIPDQTAAKTRVENIGMDNDINARALADLRVLDKLNGTNHAEKAMDLFDARRLGVNPEGALAKDPMQVTGARGYAVQKGRLIGGAAGGLLGLLVDRSGGALAGGGIAGAWAGDLIALAYSNLGSPAGAVAAYRKLNAIAEARFPRAAALSRTLQQTAEPAARARIIAEINRELNKDEERKQAPGARLGPLPRLQTERR